MGRDNRWTESIIVESETLSEMKLILDFIQDSHNVEIVAVVDRKNMSLIIYKHNSFYPLDAQKRLEEDIENKAYLKKNRVRVSLTHPQLAVLSEIFNDYFNRHPDKAQDAAYADLADRINEALQDEDEG